jgi:glycosyl hydrolase family 123
MLRRDSEHSNLSNINHKGALTMRKKYNLVTVCLLLVLVSCVKAINKPINLIEEKPQLPMTQTENPEKLGFKELPFIEKTQEPKLTETEKKRGYIIFHRPITEVVYPNTIPKSFERTDSLKSFAARGEFETLSFALYPLRELKKFTVRLSELKNGDSIISEENIDIRLVAYWNIRYPDYRKICHTYRRVPELLEKVTSYTSPAKECQRYWINIKVPDDCKPGVYSGEIKLCDDLHTQSITIPVKMKIFDFTLKKDPNKSFSAYAKDMHRQVHWAETDEEIRFWEKAADNSYKAMTEYGIDTPPILPVHYDDKNDKLYFHCDGAAIDKMKKHGIVGPVPCIFGWLLEPLYMKHYNESNLKKLDMSKIPDEKFFLHISRLIREFETLRKKRGWPELIYNPVDEPSAKERAFAVKVFKAVKNTGARTYITKNPTTHLVVTKAFAPFVDIWCSQPYAVPYEQIKESGKEYWSYPNHIANENRDPKVMTKGGRMTYGLGFWKSGYSKLIPWTWHWVNKRKPMSIEYLVPNKQTTSGNKINKNGEFVPATYWTCFREGIDDGRYIYTLQTAIIQREGTRNKECLNAIDNANLLLKAIWGSFNHQAMYLYNNSLSSFSLNAIRWKVALAIQELKKYPALNSKIAPSVLSDCELIKETPKESGIEKFIESGNVELSPVLDKNDEWRNLTKEGNLEIGQKCHTPYNCLKYKVKVDHKIDGGGEGGNYPIGWPRIRVNFKPNRDFSEFSGICTWIKVSSNRNDVDDDSTFLGINTKSGSGERVFDIKKLLGAVPENKWIFTMTEFDDILKKVNGGCGDSEDLKNIASMQIYTAESNFPDKTNLTFDIDGPYLFKFKQPFILNVDCPPFILLSDSLVLPVTINILGLRKNTALLTKIYSKAGEVILKHTHNLKKQESELFLPIASMVPGDYILKVTLAGSGNVISKQFNLNNGAIF